MTLDVSDRFWAKVDASGDCWEWVAAKSASGYGMFGVGTRTVRPHRIAYEALVGPIADGLDLDHLCRNRACVNPDHLEPVTRLENVRRGRRGKVTACPAGHPYDADNTYVYQGRRYCRACHLIHNRANKARRRAINGCR